jgi:hypothetical protein
MSISPQETRTAYDVVLRGPLAIVTIEHRVASVSPDRDDATFEFVVPRDSAILEEDTRYTPPPEGMSHARVERIEKFPGHVKVEVEGAAAGGSLVCRMRYATPVAFEPDARIVVPTHFQHLHAPWAASDETDGRTARITASVLAGAASIRIEDAREDGTIELGRPIVARIVGFRPFPIQGVTSAGAPVDLSIDPSGPAPSTYDVDLIHADGASEALAAAISETAGLDPKAVQTSSSDDLDRTLRRILRQPGRDVVVIADAVFPRQVEGQRPARRLHVLCIGAAAIDPDLLRLAVSSGGTVAVADEGQLRKGIEYVLAAAGRARPSVMVRNAGRGATKAVFNTGSAVLDILISPEATASPLEDVGTYVDRLMAVA